MCSISIKFLRMFEFANFTDEGLENDPGLPNGKLNQKKWLCMACSLV